MNVPTYPMLDAILAALGSSSAELGGGSIGLIASALRRQPVYYARQLTEANYDGYARQGVGSPSTTFNSADGNVYVEFSTLQFAPTGSSTPNTIYGLFWTPGNSTTTCWATDVLAANVYFSGPQNRLTITPRMGLTPANPFGLNVISN